MKIIALAAFYLFVILIGYSWSGSDRGKLQDEVTRLEGEIDIIDAQIQKKQEIQFRLEDQRGSADLNQEERIDLENRIERVKADISLLQKDLEQKKEELSKTRKKLIPEEPASHYHPRPKEAKLKYPFSK